MISNTIEKSNLTEDLSILIDKELRDTFKIVSNSIGFIPAIDKVLKIYNSMEPKYSLYNKREIFDKELQNIQFLNDKELNSSSMIEISNGFENHTNLTDEHKIFILYQHFKNIYFNESINKRVKNSLLEK